MTKPKRYKLEIYNAILTAIRQELADGEAKTTRIQSKSNMAYEKLTRYL